MDGAEIDVDMDEVHMEMASTPTGADAAATARGFFGPSTPSPLHDLAALDGDFHTSYAAPAAHPSAPPNLLRIGVHSARGLDAVDKEFFTNKKWSDPRMKFKVRNGDGTTHTLASAHKEKNLDPVWKEHLHLEITPPVDATDWGLDVECVCEDVDKTSAADYMGSFSLRLAPHVAAGGTWRKLEDPKKKLKRVHGSKDPRLEFYNYLLSELSAVDKVWRRAVKAVLKSKRSPIASSALSKLGLRRPPDCAHMSQSLTEWSHIARTGLRKIKKKYNNLLNKRGRKQ